ncbi:MAG TPA: hypothetical protein VF526_16250 [Solirubrobacteraceae bacterium]|jgi:hypothetical protein
MKIGVALREAHDAESDLAAQLLRIGERHKADHDVYHLTRTLSAWSDRHVHRLAEHAARYDLDLDADAVDEQHDQGLLARVREKGSELVGQRPEPGLLLLRDLRDLHLAAARASLAWTVLGQGAQAISDAELLQTVTACHPDTIRTMKWTVQKLKEASPQVLAS